MSFLGGAECSTAGNPLTSFSKHVQNDQSLQRDRLVNRGPGAAEGMRSQQPMGQQDQQMNDFLQQNGSLSHGPPQPFAMEQMRRELERFSPQQQGSRTGSPGWANEFDHASAPQTHSPFNQSAFRPPGFSAGEFQNFQHAETQRTAGQGISQTPNTMYNRPYNMGYMGGMGMGMGMGYNSMTPMARQQEPTGKGKERMVELDDKDWEQQFAALDTQGNVLDEAAMEEQLNNLDRSVHEHERESETLHGDFEAVWRGIQAEREANRGLVNDHDDLEDYDGPNPFGDFDNFGMNHGFRDPQLGDYMFETDNVFRTLGDPFSEGMKIIDEGGNLSLAALAFEAAAQKNPQHVDAWVMLGSAQAQNEKEAPAIRALEQAIKLDPANLEALMGLAVSYTNDGYDATAYRTLERWLSVKYPLIIGPDQLSSPNEVGFTDRQQLHERITNLFIKAAQLSPNGEQMDPDVQVGLGVLFYGCEEYDKAVDCLEAAIASTESGTTNQRRQIHLLWNRLGATLANSGKSEQAIAAYEKALQMNPNFVRARYNLGVSCINMGCYAEAVQHFLGALNMHKVVEREGKERVREVTGGVDEGELERMMNMNNSTNLYETLRRALMQMDRRDLAEKVVPGMDLNIFRPDFDF